ncbi:MAG: hypothetical protein LUF89_08770 [Ruminococcus sp.]|nr:hypothetical protein [Ruminococcus sp.]
MPSEKELTEKLSELLEQRKTFNQEYKTISKQIKDLDKARQTISDYLKLAEKNSTREEETLA